MSLYEKELICLCIGLHGDSYIVSYINLPHEGKYRHIGLEQVRHEKQRSRYLPKGNSIQRIPITPPPLPLPHCLFVHSIIAHPLLVPLPPIPSSEVQPPVPEKMITKID